MIIVILKFDINSKWFSYDLFYIIGDGDDS